MQLSLRRPPRSLALAALALSACAPAYLDPILTGLSEPPDDHVEPGEASNSGGGSLTSSGDSGDDPGTSGASNSSGGDGPGTSGASSSSGGDDPGTSGASSSSGGDEPGETETTAAPVEDCSQGVAWVRVIDGEHPFEVLRGLAVDAAGNVVIVGEFVGTADFGAGAMDASQEGTMYVVKYAPDGTALWSRKIGQSLRAEDVTFDAAGDVVIVGSYWASTDLGGGPLAVTPGNLSGFVLKLTANGDHVWSKGFAASVEYVTGHSVAADATGDIAVTLQSREPLDFGGGPVGNSMQNGVVLRFASDGALVWARAFSGVPDSGEALAGSVAFDPAGAVVVAGLQDGTVDFGGGPDTVDKHRVFIVKLAADGALQWVVHSEGQWPPSMADIATDDSGRIVLAGSFRKPLSFGGPLLIPSIDDADSYVFLQDGDGETLWSDGYGVPATAQEIQALAVNGAGERVVAGQFFGDIDFGGGVLSNDKEHTDIFVARQGPLGEHRWSRSFGGTGQMFASDAAIDAAGATWIAGVFDGELIVGDQVFTTGFGDYQVYVMKLCADGPQP